MSDAAASPLTPAHSVQLTADELVVIGMLSGLTRAQATRMMLAAFNSKQKPEPEK